MSKQTGPLTPIAAFLPRRRNHRAVSTPHFCVERPSSPHRSSSPHRPPSPHRPASPSVHHDAISTISPSTHAQRRIQATSYTTYSPHCAAKPLKPSLKSSTSTPLLPADAYHSRTNSEPTAAAKSVQFKEGDLESIRLYRPMGRPARLLSSAAASDTETETESDASHLGDRPAPALSLDSSLEVDYSRSSPLRWAPAPDSNILLESLYLPHVHDTSGIAMLHGTVLVRNIAYEKDVFMRFTLDNWDTVSEVRAGYDGPVGDATRGPYASYGPWDRFRFAISLPTGAHSRTMLLAARYTVPEGGEWWDNNRGENYSVAFRRGRPKSSSGVLPLSRTRKVISPQRRAAAPLQSVQDQATGIFISTSGGGVGRVAIRGTRAWSRR
jgi:hypothetical protein